MTEQCGKIRKEMVRRKFTEGKRMKNDKNDTRKNKR